MQSLLKNKMFIFFFIDIKQKNIQFYVSQQSTINATKAINIVDITAITAAIITIIVIPVSTVGINN